MINRIKHIAYSKTAFDSVVSFSGSFAVTIAGMLFTILAARSLEPSQFGVFSTFMAVAIVLSNVADLGISNVLTNFLPKHPEDRQKIINDGFWFQAFVALLVFGVSIFLIPVGKKLFGTQDPLAFGLFAAVGAGYVIDYFLQNLFRAEKKFLESSFMQSIESFGKLLMLFLVGVVFPGWLGIYLLMIVSILGALLAIIFGYWHYKDLVKGFVGFGYVSRFADFGAWMAVNKVFGVMIARVDLLILNWLSNSYQTGLFAAASRVAMVFSILVSTIGSVSAPRFASFDTSDKVVSYLKKLSLMIGGFTLLIFLCAIAADVIVVMVFGEKYIAAIGVFRALSIAMIPFLWTTLTVTPLIYTYGMARFNAFTTVLQVAIIIGVELWTSKEYGAFAPVIALGISNTVVFLISSVILIKKIRE